ncbi:MAG: ParB/RepB/Spo0J family partition protein, partial [Acidimicrobiales bacterium]
MATTSAAAAAAPTVDALTTEDFAVIPTASIRPAVENRRFVKDETWQELVGSIRDLGILVPLIVRPIPEKDEEARDDDVLVYELIAGERRWTVAAELGLETVPAIVLDYSADADRLAVMYAENASRKELSTMDRSRHIAHLAKLGLSQRDIAARLHMSQPQVSKLQQLLKLPEKAQQWVDEGALTQDDAVKLAGLPKATQEELVKEDLPRKTWRIENVRRDVESAKAITKATKEAEAKGWKILDLGPSWDAEDMRDGGAARIGEHSPGTTLAHVDETAHEAEP